MALLEILQYPHSTLLKKAIDVIKIDKSIKKLIYNMFETMYDFDGIGLAAPQIGISKKIITMDVPKRKIIHKIKNNIDEENSCNQINNNDNKQLKSFGIFTMINPIIIEKSSTQYISEEGCLSVASQRIILPRFEKIIVEYLDINSIKKRLMANGLLSRCIQHEIDHLNGITILNPKIDKNNIIVNEEDYV